MIIWIFLNFNYLLIFDELIKKIFLNKKDFILREIIVQVSSEKISHFFENNSFSDTNFTITNFD